MTIPFHPDDCDCESCVFYRHESNRLRSARPDMLRRYAMTQSVGLVWPYESPHGGWVKFDDAAARITQLEDGLTACQLARDVLRRLVAQMLPYIQQFEAADAAEMDAQSCLVREAQRALAEMLS